MRKLYLLVLLNISFHHLNSQNYEWAKDEGHYAYDYGYGIGTDNSGNIYVAGKYEENAVFSGVTLPNQGNHDIWVASYSPSGSLNWIHTAGGPGGDYAHALHVNRSSGKVLIAGEIEGGTCSFQGSIISINSHGDNDVFFAQYDMNGTIEWAKREGYYYNEKALGITNDNSGNIFICGYFVDSTMFGGSTVAGKGAEDIFVAKYNSSGVFQWMRSAGGPGRDEAKSIVTDASGNVYICGMYSDGAIFGSTTYNTANTSIGHFFDAYVAKYDPNGGLVWVRPIVGDYDEVAWSITMDSNGKIYAGGEFTGADFGNGTVVWSSGLADAFVASYDQGGSYQWMSHGGGSYADRARGIGTDGTDIFVTGQFGYNGNFGSASITAADSSDIFVARLDNSGNFIWASSVGGPVDNPEYDGYESGNAVCADPGSAYVTGALLDGGTFGSNTVTGYTRTDVFITKMSTVAGVAEYAKNSNLVLYPNPASNSVMIRSKEQLNKAEISISNSLGELIYKEISDSPETKVDLSNFAKGVYLVKVNSGKEVLNEKLILR